jgi:hypothetical protein
MAGQCKKAEGQCRAGIQARRAEQVGGSMQSGQRSQAGQVRESRQAGMQGQTDRQTGWVEQAGR